MKDSGGNFDDNSILPKIRQILLHCGYKLTENFFFFYLLNKLIDYFFFSIKHDSLSVQ